MSVLSVDDIAFLASGCDELLMDIGEDDKRIVSPIIYIIPKIEMIA